MLKCGGCGAALADDAAACGYCGTLTARAAEERRAQAVIERVEQDAERARVEAQIGRTSLWALAFAILGGATCCLFVPGIVGLMQARRAQKLARSHGLPLPATAVAAIPLSLASLAFGLVFFVWFAIDQSRLEARKAELEAAFTASRGAVELDQATACAFAEHALLDRGWAGKGGISVDRFECVGRLTQTATSAVLEEVRFELSSELRPVLRACFVRTSVWRLDRLVDGACSP